MKSGYTFGMQVGIRKALRRYPRARGAARALYRSSRYLAVRMMGRLRRDPLRPLWVDPLAITQTIASDDPALTGNAVGHIGSVDGGDWDRNGVAVRAHDGVYAILEERVVNGRDWAAIPAYQENLARIKAGAIVDSAATPEEYAARWAATEALFERIAREGYKTQAELEGGDALDEVRVQIGRGGELLFEEGLHRLVIAQLLALPRIPALVTRRHAQWAALRDAVLHIVGQRGFFHQPFGHPDLDCLNEWYGSELAKTAVYGEERWELIRNAMPDVRGPKTTTLDIGAYFGYFCHRFEELGFDCTAVEPDELNVAVLRRWREIEGRRFAVREMSIFDLLETQFDVVLALNIFHHFVRTRQGYEQLVAFLRRLECRAMFFEPDGNEGIESYRHFSDEEFVEFVLAHTRLEKARLLGRAREGRKVYLLMK